MANTPQQIGVAERMNITLLERKRAMLRAAGLEKSFSAEAINTAYYLVNRIPLTAIELKTPIEMWTGKTDDYSNLHVFGSIVYVMYNSQEISKLDPKSRKYKFLGYADEVKRYRLWDPTARKVIIIKNVIFVEDKLQRKEKYSSAEKSETTQIHVENEDGEPSTYQEAINSSDASLWMMVMQEEIEALHKNNTWDLVPLPQGRKPIGNKWVFKIKRNGDAQVERYRARLMVKGYAQKEGLNKDHIEELKAQLAREFEMKDLGSTNKILGMQIHRDIKDGDVSSTVCISSGKFNVRYDLYKTRHRTSSGSSYSVHGESRQRALEYSKEDPEIPQMDLKCCIMLRRIKLTYQWSVVATSTTETEYVVATQASKETIWLKMLLEELGHNQEYVIMFCDSQSALHLARNPTFHSRTKHIRVQYHFIREKVEEETIDMQKIHTKDNITDFMTKAINTDNFDFALSDSHLPQQWWPSCACTFIENHDTGSTQILPVSFTGMRTFIPHELVISDSSRSSRVPGDGYIGHWPFPRDKLAQGYSYILTHPGTPVIFYDHLYEFGMRDIMTELIEARRRAGIHCRSSVKIYHANNEGYVARVGDTLVMKLGYFNWNPSKENQLDGSWQKFIDKGSEYQVWLRQ
ncbi:pentatricopeptide repeat-containing protein [Hibiscus syriacus]|uniref:alpha-amylase n=1 Tax=Hibiscus syriacus TaxID=106335 RepID=A0A6A3A1I4_HIBSY|nr:pentatricopeptide repeat-containing protein [Hibiscus syriacus]